MRYIVGLVVAAFFWWLVCYYMHVATYWPMILVHIGVFALFFAGGSALAEAAQRRETNYAPAFFGVMVAAVCLVIGCFIIPIFGHATFRASTLRELGNVKRAEKPMEVADTRHIRIIPLETAEWIGNQVIGKGNLGALFELNHYEIQRVRDTLYWVAPLEFRGWFAWRKANYTSPGYVMVNAEDPNAEPKLVTGYQMRYTWGAWFGSNFLRHVYYGGYQAVNLTEPTFEVDESGKPYYVICASVPQVGFIGDKAEKIIILDPESGKIESYEVGKTPKWVDRAFPLTIAMDYASYYGAYIHGFWNAQFGHQDVQQISPVEYVTKDSEGENVVEEKKDMFLVYNSTTTNPIWVAGMTSPSAKDTSLTGYLTVDSVTGEMIEYPVSGNGNEKAALQAVVGDPEVSRQPNYHASQGILYCIYGVETWVVPVLSPAHIIEKVGIVYGRGSVQHVAVGDSLEEALDRYRALLAELKVGGVVPTNVRLTRKITGRVVRITAEESGSRYILLDGLSTKLLGVSRGVSAELLVTQPGDPVAITYEDTNEEIASVKSFDNLALDLRKSPEQKGLEERRAAETAQSRAELEAKQRALQEEQRKLQEEMYSLQ